MAEEIIESLPDFVDKMLRELQGVPVTESIWLVGSRANRSWTANSDWDLLVFSSVEPDVVSRRCKDIDVIRVGPSRKSFLLEGQPLDFLLPFAGWQWHEIDEDNALYVSRKFIDYPLGARDASEPACVETVQRAYRIWSKEKTVP